MTTINTWSLEERVEDALVLYLQSKTTVKIYPAFTDEGLVYPSAAVMVDTTKPIEENAVTEAVRIMEVAIAVMTEAVPVLSSTGATVKTSRDRNADARNDILQALMVDGLCALVQGFATDVLFSEIDVSGTSRTVEPELRKLVTTITLDVIAQPKVTG